MIVSSLSQQALKNSTRKTRANWMFIWEYYPKEQVGRNESRLILCARAWICNFKVHNFHGEWREKNFFINSSLHLTRAAQWVLVLTLPCWMYTSVEPFFSDSDTMEQRTNWAKKKWCMWHGLEAQYHSLHKVAKALVVAFSLQQWCRSRTWLREYVVV